MRKMGDTENYDHSHNHNQQQQQRRSTFGMRDRGGEIVEVQGGHILRSISRKDRHSKVCTAKGPRDRRVRLSAHTAIHFYDVQDRLGYDRPSKAVDWLIKKAQAAINQLEELPAWKPNIGSLSNSNLEQDSSQQEENLHQLGFDNNSNSNSNSNSKQSVNNSSFLPRSMDSDSIADTIKSFFPTGASPEGNSSAGQFQSYTQPNTHQDLRLSLQSFQQQAQQHQNPNTHQSQQTIFTGTPLGFAASGGSGWSENQPADISRIQRMFSWNTGGNNSGDSSAGALMFNSLAPSQLFGQNNLFSQRGPLQSSNTPSVRAWIDPAGLISAVDLNHHQQQQIHQLLPFNQSTVGFTSGSGFTGFGIPTRIQGDQEEHCGISDKPSSDSSDSRH